MSEIRSQRMPSFMKCVVTKIVTFWFPRQVDQQLPEAVAGDRIDADVGSSRMRICGSCRTATASERR